MQNNIVSDAQFFEEYVHSFVFIYNEPRSGMAFIKDANFVYNAISSDFIDLTTENEFGSLLGKTDSQIKALKSFESVVRSIKSQDELVRDSRKAQDFLYFATDKNVFIINKYPIINPSTNNFVGIRALMFPLILAHPLKMIYQINQVEHNMLNAPEGVEPLSFRLTEKQHMVLFLYINKYSYSEIAEIMTKLGYKISSERVNDHLSKLKYIFLADDKNDLIVKALSLDYHLYLPRKFLQVDSYPLSEEAQVSHT
jgi:hypothetical protein